jgi:hypothetical protein
MPASIIARVDPLSVLPSVAIALHHVDEFSTGQKMIEHDEIDHSAFDRLFECFGRHADGNVSQTLLDESRANGFCQMHIGIADDHGNIVIGPSHAWPILALALAHPHGFAAIPQ